MYWRILGSYIGYFHNDSLMDERNRVSSIQVRYEILEPSTISLSLITLSNYLVDITTVLIDSIFDQCFAKVRVIPEVALSGNITNVLSNTNCIASFLWQMFSILLSEFCIVKTPRFDDNRCPHGLQLNTFLLRFILKRRSIRGNNLFTLLTIL